MKSMTVYTPLPFESVDSVDVGESGLLISAFDELGECDWYPASILSSSFSLSFASLLHKCRG